MAKGRPGRTSICLPDISIGLRGGLAGITEGVIHEALHQAGHAHPAGANDDGLQLEVGYLGWLLSCPVGLTTAWNPQCCPRLPSAAAQPRSPWTHEASRSRQCLSRALVRTSGLGEGFTADVWMWTVQPGTVRQEKQTLQQQEVAAAAKPVRIPLQAGRPQPTCKRLFLGFLGMY
ncbi:hypothetical protein NDU88_004923 [Pleurodeles waltl]|uniref:Uncharacterized protein n=1 Tax=Pleurodeles waltl TaxID=8319 RepID=A0AAV7W8X5_PLEWA|nr:hypothetical protein NDU88_004923 [Pleurodeles waltl]